MYNLQRKKFTKNIVFLLSFLMIWQGVAWALPGTVPQNTLAPWTFFSPPDGTDEFPSDSLTCYLLRSLTRFEEGIRDRAPSLAKIKEYAEYVVGEFQMTGKGKVPPGFQGRVPALSGSPAAGAVMIDLGTFIIRYYDPRRADAEEPHFPCQVVRGSDKKLGEYLSRQILVRQGRHTNIHLNDNFKLLEEIPTIESLRGRNLQGKRVLVRVNFNVQSEGGKIKDTLRLDNTREIVRFLIEKGATPILYGHNGRKAKKKEEDNRQSLKDVADYLRTLFPDVEIVFHEGSINENGLMIKKSDIKLGKINVLENVRFADEYELGSRREEFACSLVALSDGICIFDAFGDVGSKGASVEDVPGLAREVYVGPSMVDEFRKLKKELEGILGGFDALIFGGAKLEKVDLLQSLLGCLNTTGFALIGSGPSNALDTEQTGLLEKLRGIKASGILTARDYSDDTRYDIGDRTISDFLSRLDTLRKGQTVVVNGTMGFVEHESGKYTRGTRLIWEKLCGLALRGVHVVIVGGDASAMSREYGLVEKPNVVVFSGGGVPLKILAGKTLAGLKAYSNRQRDLEVIALLEARDRAGRSNFPPNILSEDPALFARLKGRHIPIYSKQDDTIYVWDNDGVRRVLLEQYAQGKNDEKMISIINIDENGNPVSRLTEKKAIFNLNFRADRQKQWVRAMLDPLFNAFEVASTALRTLIIATARYIPAVEGKNVLIKKKKLRHGLVEVLNEEKIRMVYVFDAEKGKFIPFFRGGTEEQFANEDLRFGSISMPVLMNSVQFRDFREDIDVWAKVGEGKYVTWFYGEIPKGFGSSDFCIEEFRNTKLSVQALCDAIRRDCGFGKEYLDGTIEGLNRFVESPDFYESWMKELGKGDARGRIEEDGEIEALVRETETYRSKDFSALDPGHKAKRKRLSRLLLEKTYPDRCPEARELRQIPNSEYRRYPGLSMFVLAQASVKSIKEAVPGTVGLTNFSGPDLVGHVAAKEIDKVTKLFVDKGDGTFEIKEGDGWASALECLKIADRCLAMTLEAVREKEGVFILVGDHGSLDDMTQPGHSFNDVPLFIVDFKKKDIRFVRAKGGRKNTQADVAATILHILGKQKPSTMEGESLLPQDYQGSGDRVIWINLLDGFGHTDFEDKNNAFGRAISEGMTPTIEKLYKNHFVGILKASGYYAGLRGGREEDFDESHLIRDRGRMIKEVQGRAPGRIRITYYDYRDIKGASRVYMYEQGIYELTKCPFLNDKIFVVEDRHDDTVEVLCLDPAQMGSTEYNTWTLGAGSIVEQSIRTIDRMWISGRMSRNAALRNYTEFAKKQGEAHIVGILQEAGVHSSARQLYYTVQHLKKNGVTRFVFDLASDGRDEGAQDCLVRLRQLRSALEYFGITDYVINIRGREICFDRAKNWNLTEAWLNELLWGSRIKRVPKQAPLQTKVRDLILGRIKPVMLGARAEGIKGERKPTGDYVTEADRKVGEILAEELAALIPGSLVIEEESFKPEQFEKAKSTRFVWIVDPIDGTRAFMEDGNPEYCVAICLLDRGRPVLSTVYAPELTLFGKKGCLFEAVDGVDGAYLNGERISFNQSLDFAKGKCVSHTHVYDEMTALEKSIAALFGRKERIKAYDGHSTILHYCMAAGAVEAGPGVFTRRDAKIWDVVSAAYIVKKARGIVMDIEGQEILPLDFDRLSAEGKEAAVPFTVACSLGAKDKMAELLSEYLMLNTEKITKNAENVMSRLAEALIEASQKREEVILALDLGLGKGEINRLIRELIKVFTDLRASNPGLKEFFEKLEIVRGEGEGLAERLRNVTTLGMGKVKPENVIVVTKNLNERYFKERGFHGRATITCVDDSRLSETDYLPLPAIAAFAVGKYLGWSEDQLRRSYGLILNAEKLDERDFKLRFGEDKKTMVIRLIPNAVPFDKNELRALMESIKYMLASA